VQVLITVGLFWVLLKEIRWIEFRELAAQLSGGLVAMSIALLMICHLLNTARWRWILWHNTIGYGTLLVWYGVGVFSSNFLPTGIGGDAVRAMLLSRRVPWRQALFSVGVDRGLGIASLSIFVFLGFWYGLPQGLTFQVAANQQEILLGLAIGLVGFGLVGGLIWYQVPTVRRAGQQLWERIFRQPDAESWTRWDWILVLVGGIAFSAASHLLLMLARWCILLALGIHVSFGAVVWVSIIAALSLLLPITINGLGLQEGIYIIVLAAYGVPYTAALGTALLMRALLLLVSGVGGIMALRCDLSGISLHKEIQTGNQEV
jgi:hypothetical protein